MERPNILFLFADDQRHDTIAALGNPHIRTPNLDRLVARGVAFTQAHIPGGTSAAICMPSRAMLFTGRSLFRLHDAGQTIPEEHPTLGEVLRRHGYHTFGCGKWHNGPGAFQRSFADGDEIFFGGMADHWNVPLFRYDPSGQYDATLPAIPDPFTGNRIVHRRCDHIYPGRHSSEILSDAAVRFLHAYRGSRPFFLYVSYLAPHDPRTVPPEYTAMYDPAEIELPPNFLREHPFNNGDHRVRDEKLVPTPRDPGEIRRHISEYYASITYLDAQIGKVLDALEATGLAENTLVVFAADNGLAVGQHGLLGKQNCYDHSVRVPLIMAGPGIPRGERRDAYVYLFDLFPTLCDLVGAPVPPSVDARSFAHILHEPKAPGRESLYFAYLQYQRAVKDRRYKLIEYVVDGRHSMTQLFDLVDDPWETRNLAGDPGYGDCLERLRRELRTHAVTSGDLESEWGKAFWPAYDRAN